MKKIVKRALYIITLLLLTSVAVSQGPPPPGGGPTETDPPVGQAPVGDGFLMLMSLAAAFGTFKVYNARK